MFSTPQANKSLCRRRWSSKRGQFHVIIWVFDLHSLETSWVRGWHGSLEDHVPLEAGGELSIPSSVCFGTTCPHMQIFRYTTHFASFCIYEVYIGLWSFCAVATLLVAFLSDAHGSQVQSNLVKKKYPLGLSSLLPVTNNDKRLINYHYFRIRPLQTIIIHWGPGSLG